MSKNYLKISFCCFIVFLFIGNSYVFADKCDMGESWFNKGADLSDGSEREAYYYEKAIELCPEYIKAYVNLGWNYYRNAEYSKSIKYSKKALDIDPFRPTAHFNLGSAYKDIKKYNKAIEHIEKAYKYFNNDDKKSRAMYLLTQVYYEQDEYKKVYEKSQEIIKAYPYSRVLPYAQNGVAWVLAVCPDKNNRSKEALNYAMKASRTLSDKWFVNSTLAAAYARNGQFNEAKETQEKTIAMMKNIKATKKNKIKEYLDESYDRLKLYEKGQAYTKKGVKCPTIVGGLRHQKYMSTDSQSHDKQPKSKPTEDQPIEKAVDSFFKGLFGDK